MISSQIAGAAFRSSLIALFVATGTGTAAHAASPACAAAGQVPPSLRVAPADADSVAQSLTMLPWSGGDQLKFQDARSLTGDCQASVISFSGSDIYLKGGLMVQLGENGELSAASAAPTLPAIPAMKEEKGDDHSHSDAGLGEYMTAARVDVSRSTSGMTEYFVGVWKNRQTATLAIFARSADGIQSIPAPLLRSKLPVRGVSYLPAPDSPAGTLGITQEVAPGELRLINVWWTHRDFTR